MSSVRRPTTILGLAARLVLLRLQERRWRRGVLALVALSLAVVFAPWPSCGGVRVATFNIENYPRSARQEGGAFEAIRALAAVAIGVQEITDPDAFAAAARRRLGDRWRFVFAEGGPKQRVGVLFDGDALELLSTRTHRVTEVYSGAKPAFESRLRPPSGDAIRLIVIHLKSGQDSVKVRRRQLSALRPVVAEAMRSGDRVVLLGDFNATSDDDRSEIAGLADALDMTWASKGVACTSYWARRDGCRGSALDHVLTWAAPRRTAARGPCETEGCEPGAECPVFHREVSDHCPVTVDLR